MATVTGLTAARMLVIEAGSVVSGIVNVEGRLILTTHGGIEIDAGNVYSGTPEPETIAYTYLQSAPLSVWNVFHTLPFTPAVLTVDSTQETVLGDVEIISSTHVRITFSAPFSGTVYLS